MSTTYMHVTPGTDFYALVHQAYTGPKRWKEALPEIAELLDIPKFHEHYEDGSTLRMTPDIVAEHEHLEKHMKFDKGSYTPKKNTKQGKAWIAGFQEIAKKHRLNYDRFGLILFMYDVHPGSGKGYSKMNVARFDDDYYMKWENGGDVPYFLDEISETEYLRLELAEAERKEQEAEHV